MPYNYNPSNSVLPFAALFTLGPICLGFNFLLHPDHLPVQQAVLLLASAIWSGIVWSVWYLEFKRTGKP
jgi:hypothetical protein